MTGLRIRAAGIVWVAIALAAIACGGSASGGPSIAAPSGDGGGPVPIATIIAGQDPRGGPDRPPESPATGGPIPSFGLSSPHVAEGQASLLPRPTPRPDGGEIVTYLISPADYFEEVIRPGSTLTVYRDGSIQVDSVRDQVGDNHLEWALPAEIAPAQEDVLDVYARGCGTGAGDFYEIYGPWDSVEFEYEVTPPAADGCWHFSQAIGKSFEFQIWLHGDATMTINRLELVVTLKP